MPDRQLDLYEFDYEKKKPSGKKTNIPFEGIYASLEEFSVENEVSPLDIGNKDLHKLYSQEPQCLSTQNKNRDLMDTIDILIKKIEEIDGKIDEINVRLNENRQIKYFRPHSEQEEGFIQSLIQNDIPHGMLYSPKGTIFRISAFYYNHIKSLGYDLEEVQVLNLGSLSPEERKRIKDYNKLLRESRKGTILKRLRKEYGPVK